MPTNSEGHRETVGEALTAAIERLQAAGSESARIDAVLLLASVLDRDGAWFLAHADETLIDRDRASFAAAIARRGTGEPVAYILGSTGFYGRSFVVDANVLVPRPDTETLVAAALRALRERGEPEPSICDVGTGSGILAITLACEVSTARVTAIDISPAALDVARRNARALGVAERIRFVLGDGLAAAGDGERFACVVANLPYVKTGEIAAAPDPVSFEPRIALDGGRDGLALYRPLLRAARYALEAGGSLVMEAGPNTVPALAAETAAVFGAAASVVVERDFSGHERVVIARARPGTGGSSSRAPET